MPIYEYKCQKCGYAVEVIQRLSDEPLVDCPSCGAPAMKKQVSAPTFRLSGKGWYETDFKTGDKKNIAGEKSDSSGGETKTSDTSPTSNGGPAKSNSETATKPKKTDNSETN